jgi:hypothetical protein
VEIVGVVILTVIAGQEAVESRGAVAEEKTI